MEGAKMEVATLPHKFSPWLGRRMSAVLAVLAAGDEFSAIQLLLAASRRLLMRSCAFLISPY